MPANPPDIQSLFAPYCHKTESLVSNNVDSLSHCIFMRVVHSPAVCLKAWKTTRSPFFLVVALDTHNMLIV
ncbi:hypothetical protein NSPZN2_30699 [Nitrospira defluvii]|uniref:Uncharacterized protein n=1 Tax=Nitrospira defluvii TaxID=330214 RepID=A0ABM8RN68_9BACT|nr:hypothetical protein NSPZN2_30699 [Nitrospira defluvii]